MVYKNKLWITGGDRGSSSYSMLYTTEYITPNGDTLPGPNLPIKLMEHSVINVNSTHALVIGGRTYGSSGEPVNKVINTTWYFDHKDQTFTEGPKLNMKREGFSVGLMKDSVTKEDLIVIAGGSQGFASRLNSVEILRNGMWQQGIVQ